MQIDYVDGRFVVRCAFDERHLVKDAGFDWHPELRRWVTSDPRVALTLSEHLTANARKIIAPPSDLILPEGIDPQTGKPFSYMPFQGDGIKFALPRHSVLIADEPGLGKGHPLSTRLATPNGMRPLGDLTIGDDVIGSTGRPVRVQAIYDRGILPVYSVITSDGASVTCDGEHLWTIYDPDRLDWIELTTVQIVGMTMAGIFPVIPPLGGSVQFLEREFSISPRVAALNCVDRHLYPELFQIDPRDYQFGSVAQRTGFLTAVVRTLGRVREGAIRVDIKAARFNEALVETIVQIVRSLGGLAFKKPMCGKTRIRIELPEPIWLPIVGYSKRPNRINHRWKNFRPGVSERRIIAVRPAGFDQVRCITVDAKDQLYVTEDYLVTHNTVQAIGIGNQLPMLDSMLVVCFASHKEMWMRMIEKWDVHNLSVDIAYGNYFPDSQAVIINYDILDRHYAALRSGRWGSMVVDEAHALQNEETKRCKQVLGGSQLTAVDPTKPKGRKHRVKLSPIFADRRIFLTGTPMPNRPRSMWPLIRACDPLGLGRDKQQFQYRYCGAYETGFGLDDSGATNLDEFYDRLTFMSRHLKVEVMKDLPPKTRQVIPLSSEGLSRKLAAERDAVSELLRQYEEKHGMSVPASTDMIEHILHAPPQMFDDYARNADVEIPKDTPLNRLAIARQELALAKVPMIVEHVENLLQAERKVLVFGYHQSVIEALCEAFAKYDPAVIYGKTPVKKRQGQEDKFQNQDSCRVFIGNFTAAGTGFTLTAGRVVVCAELTWLLHELSQAEDRAHRIGQIWNVLINHMVVVGSLDDALISRLIIQQDILDRALNGAGSLH